MNLIDFRRTWYKITESDGNGTKTVASHWFYHLSEQALLHVFGETLQTTFVTVDEGTPEDDNLKLKKVKLDQFSLVPKLN